MSNPFVSVIIPAYNCAKTIRQVIQALLNQTYPNIEIIIVDDGSTDKTAEIVQSCGNVQYFYQVNSGPAKARNFGAQRAAHEILFFTDSDCVAHKDWIEKAIAHFQDSSIGVVAGSYGIANSENLLARCIHKEILYRHHHLMPKNPKAFGSYNFGVRRNVFEKVGGFDVSYRNASGEDNDLSYKILKTGSKIYFEPKALVAHYHPTVLKKYLTEQYRHGFWRAKLYFQHPSMVKGDDYTFWKDIVEPILCLSVAACLVLTLLASGIFFALADLGLLTLWGIEIYYGFVMIRNFFEAFYFSFVTFFRALARTLGLSTGIIYFSVISRPIKDK